MPRRPRYPQFDHGAVTAAIVADVAENASITVYAITPIGGIPDEDNVINRINRLAIPY